MSLREEAALHVLAVGSVRVVSTISQIIFCTVVEYDEGALLTLVVDGGAIRVGDTHTVEHDSLLLRRVEFEEAVAGLARQHVFDHLVCVVGGDDVISVDAHDTTFVAADGGIARLAEGDGDGLVERRVLDVVIVVRIDVY